MAPSLEVNLRLKKKKKKKNYRLAFCSCEEVGKYHTTVWLHHLDSNEMLREKVKWKLRKNDTYCFVQIREAVPLFYKTAVQSAISYLINHSRRTRQLALLEK